MILKKILVCIPILFVFVSDTFSQVKDLGIGVQCGVGSISGNLPAQTSLELAIMLDFQPSFTYGLPLRLGAIYARKFEVILPRGIGDKYYPFIKGIYLKGVLQQPLGKVGYLEETLGPLLLNDRTYNDINSYDWGVVFSLLIGLDFRDFDNKGIKTGIGSEYGITVTQTNTHYSSFYLQVQYFF